MRPLNRSTILALVVIVLSVLVLLAYLPRFVDLLPSDESNGNAQSSQSSSALSSDTSAPSSTQTSQASTQSTTPARERVCTDSVDEDGDQLTDCDDPDCVGSASCRCSALSCGGEGPQCAPAEGCICNDTDGCVACRNEGDSCGTDADCCGGLGMSCTEILRAGGVREKRCLRSQAHLCEVTCEAEPGATEGVWDRPVGCMNDFIPPGAKPCDELVGACTVSPRPERNTTRCWDS